MSSPPSCPRCLGRLRAPDLWSSQWRCERHGAVQPWHVPPAPSVPGLVHLAAGADVPAWALAPPPVSWTLTGHGHCGDDRRGAAAAATAFCGPSPLGGEAELVLVAEEPGVGLGARLAGLASSDPGLPAGGAQESLLAAGHETPLWRVPSPPDRAGYVGEACGVWLWVVLWPADAALVLLEHLRLADLRTTEPRGLHPGAPSPHLLGQDLAGTA